ncbi:MAG: polyprenyl synthetase family protein [Pirellulales bacterium]
MPEHLLVNGLFEPAQSFLSRRGKGIRAGLVAATYELGGGVGRAPSALQDFMELLHAGSLIIDDIEDGSTSRRNHPALHCTYGLPIALNTGNWMYFLALEKLSQLDLPRVEVGAFLGHAITTIRRCHEGQALDLTARVDQLSFSEILPTVSKITRLKTGALTGLGSHLGARAAGGNRIVCSILETFGKRLGTVLQMRNDYLELKSAAMDGSSDDLFNARATWTWAWAAAECEIYEFQSYQDRLRDRSKSHIQSLAAELLDRIRDRGQTEIDNVLQQSLCQLDRHLGCGTSHRFQSVVSRLEQQ